MSEQKIHVYTDIELAAIAAAESYVDKMVAAWLPFGVDLLGEDQSPINPLDYALNKEQWGQVCKLFMQMPGSDITKTNYGMDWVNIGPSCFE